MTRTGDQTFIKELNKSIVLRLIRYQSPISRIQISKLTGLNKTTVSSIVDELIDDELILEVGRGHTKVGRRPVILLFNAKAGHAIGVDLGFDYVRVLVTDLAAQVVYTLHKPFPGHWSVEQIISLLVESIREAISNTPESRYGIIGIGVGVPGLVDFNQGIVLYAPNLQWNNVHLRAVLESYLKIPVHIDNEANMGALGEKLFGSGKNVSEMVYISAGWGIGTGIIVNNELVRGSRGIAGEFGHMTVETNGIKCACGNNGCLERYASEQALVAYMEKTTKETLSIEEILRRVQNNDPVAVQAIQTVGHYLGVGISNILNGLNPALVLIGNRMAQAGDWILRPIDQTLRARCLSATYAPYNIQVSSLGENACAIGSAALVLHHYFGQKESTT